MPFEPDAIRVACGHFLGGRRAPAADAKTVHRPSDARPHAGLPVAGAATVDTTARTADAWDVPFTGRGSALTAQDRYGLDRGVHTADIGRALRAMRGIAAGMAWINCYGRSHDFVIPTGGFGQSGIGKDLGQLAAQANLRLNSVLIDFGTAPSAEAVSAWAAFHAVAGHANESFGAAGAANRHKLDRRAC
jgi:hypothetical protein